MTQSISRDQAPSTQTKTSKAALRERLLAARGSANEDANKGAAGYAHTALATRVAALLEKLAPASLAFYWPMRGEPDLRPVVAAWLAGDPARQAALPVVEDVAALGESRTPGAPRSPVPMSFHRWTVDSPMRSGRYGIAVPENAETLHPALLLIPCVGFDKRGFRLGYGGGFYDCTLASMAPRPLTIGIAFDCTQVDRLPTETHDLPLDGILTETSGYGIAAGQSS